jgi:single-strand DNA-binding protein
MYLYISVFKGAFPYFSMQFYILKQQKSTSMNTVINKVQLSGFLARDPEIRTTTGGKQMARFSLGTREEYAKEGKTEVNVQWHTLVAWGKLAARAEAELKKGITCAIEGKLVQRNYTDTAGKKHYVTEVVVNEWSILEK